MGSSSPQRNAPSLREILVGLDRFEQHKAAADWAVANGKLLLWDIKPKNVLVTETGEIAVIDAEINQL